jgi:hypothetical protein
MGAPRTAVQAAKPTKAQQQQKQKIANLGEDGVQKTLGILADSKIGAAPAGNNESNLNNRSANASDHRAASSTMNGGKAGAAGNFKAGRRQRAAAAAAAIKSDSQKGLELTSQDSRAGPQHDTHNHAEYYGQGAGAGKIMTGNQYAQMMSAQVIHV